MTRTYQLDQIKQVTDKLDIAKDIEDGFVAYSQGRVIVPPVGEMVFEQPPGDVHIKYGFIKEDDYFAIKIASGFYQNPQLGLPSSSGLMLLFNQETDRPEAILLDEGYLTDIRTAVAGAIAAKYLAPRHVQRIGIAGTGVQARQQLRYLKEVTPCREVLVWGRGEEQLQAYREEMQAEGFQVFCDVLCFAPCALYVGLAKEVLQIAHPCHGPRQFPISQQRPDFPCRF